MRIGTEGDFSNYGVVRDSNRKDGLVVGLQCN